MKRAERRLVTRRDTLTTWRRLRFGTRSLVTKAAAWSTEAWSTYPAKRLMSWRALLDQPTQVRHRCVNESQHRGRSLGNCHFSV